MTDMWIAGSRQRMPLSGNAILHVPSDLSFATWLSRSNVERRTGPVAAIHPKARETRRAVSVIGGNAALCRSAEIGPTTVHWARRRCVPPKLLWLSTMWRVEGRPGEMCGVKGKE